MSIDNLIQEVWEGEEVAGVCSILRHVTPHTEWLAARCAKVARQIADIGIGLRFADRAASRAERTSNTAETNWEAGLRAAVRETIDALEEVAHLVLQDCPVTDRVAMARAFFGLIREVVGDDPRAELEAAA